MSNKLLNFILTFLFQNTAFLQKTTTFIEKNFQEKGFRWNKFATYNNAGTKTKQQVDVIERLLVLAIGFQ